MEMLKLRNHDIPRGMSSRIYLNRLSIRSTRRSKSSRSSESHPHGKPEFSRLKIKFHLCFQLQMSIITQSLWLPRMLPFLQSAVNRPAPKPPKCNTRTKKYSANTDTNQPRRANETPVISMLPAFSDNRPLSACSCATREKQMGNQVKSYICLQLAHEYPTSLLLSPLSFTKHEYTQNYLLNQLLPLGRTTSLD